MQPALRICAAQIGSQVADQSVGPLPVEGQAVGVHTVATAGAVKAVGA